MNFRKLLLLVICLFVAGSELQAQYGLNISEFSDRIWSQRYQPANITQGEFSKFRFGAHGGFNLRNSHASLDGILVEGGFITEEVKDRIISELKTNEVVSAGYDLSVASVNVKLGKGDQVWGFYIKDRLDATARFNDPNTFGLVLKGNGAYAGTTVADNDIFARVVHTRKIGAGTGWEFGKFRFGARLNFVQGLRMADLSRLNYSLYTETLGRQIDVQADYSLNITEQFSGVGLLGMQGYGGSVDLGLTYALNEKINLEASVLDAGAVIWQTNKIEDQIDIQWEGVYINSLFEDSIPEVLQQEVDSLRNLVFPDTVQENKLIMTPLTVRLGADFALGERSLLGVRAVYNLSRTGAYTRLPLLNVMFRQEIIDDLHLAANAYVGGTDTFGFGAMGSYRLRIKDWKVDIAAGADNFLGYLLPKFGRGFSFFAGIGVQL